MATERDPAMVVTAIMRALDITDTSGGRQPAALALLNAYLYDKQMLLVLDNFEHLMNAAPFIAELLAARVIRATADGQQAMPRLTLPGRGLRNLPDRHRTLRSAIAWSYQLLTPHEQRLFAALSIFSGSFDVAAAEAVCISATTGHFQVLDILAELVDKSLVQRDERTGELRFTMLDTIHGFAGEQLSASGQADALRRQHAAYYLERAEEADRELQTAEQADWLRRLERDHDNFSAALRWACAAPTAGVLGQATDEVPSTLALRLCVGLWKFWRYRCLFSEGYRWSVQALMADQSSARPAPLDVRAGVAWGAGVLAAAMRRDDEATVHLEASLALWRRTEDDQGIAGALTALGAHAMKRGDTTHAIALQAEALALYRSLGQLSGMAYAHNALGESLRYGGDVNASRAHYQASLELSRQAGHRRSVAVAQGNLVLLALAEGDYGAAQGGLSATLAFFLEIGDQINIATSLMGFGCVAVGQGTALPMQEAAHLFGFAHHLLGEAGGHIEVADKPIFDHHIALCRAALGEAAWAAAWAEGQGWGLEEAVAYTVRSGAGSPRM